MLGDTFRPIWTQEPRPPHFPGTPELDRLLDSYFDPTLGYFKMRMKRRNARALRRVIFGPKGIRNVPDKSGGVMRLDLPNAWTLGLTYYAAGAYDYDLRRAEAGDVDVEFIPPRARARKLDPQVEAGSLAA